MANNVIGNKIIFDDKLPFWLEDVVKVTQANEDRLYEAKLREWNVNNQTWLINAQRAFELKQDLPKPPTVPTKEIFGIKDGQLVQYTWQDPALQAPTFAPVLPSPSTPPSTDVVFKDAQMEAMTRAILQAVLAIKSKVGA